MDSSKKSSPSNPSRTYQRKKTKRVFELNPFPTASMEAPPPSSSPPASNAAVQTPSEGVADPKAEAITPLRVHAQTVSKIKKGSKAWKAMIKEMGKARRLALEEEERLRKLEESTDQPHKESSSSHPSSSHSVLQGTIKGQHSFPQKEEWRKVVAEAVRMASEQRLKSTTEQRFMNAEKELKEALATAEKKKKELEAERAMMEDEQRREGERLQKILEEKEKQLAEARKEERLKAASKQTAAAAAKQASAIAPSDIATAMLSLKGKAIAAPDQPTPAAAKLPKGKGKVLPSEQDTFDDLLSYREEVIPEPKAKKRKPSPPPVQPRKRFTRSDMKLSAAKEAKRIMAVMNLPPGSPTHITLSSSDTSSGQPRAPMEEFEEVGTAAQSDAVYSTPESVERSVSAGKEDEVEEDDYKEEVEEEPETEAGVIEITEAQRAAIKRRGCIEENGFSDEEGQLPQAISATIYNIGWSVLCQQPQPASISLVQEFYLGMQPDKSISMVRGKAVNFSSYAINDVYGLEDQSLEETINLIFNPSAGQMRKALISVAILETDWDVSAQGYRTILRKEVKEEMAVWLYFLKKRLMPTRHDTTVSLDRVMLLHCIRKSIPVNIGAIIFHEMVECWSRGAGRLFFPSLIGELCKRAGVVVHAGEQTCKVLRPIDSKLIKSLEGHMALRHQRETPASASSKRPQTPSSDDAPAQSPQKSDSPLAGLNREESEGMEANLPSNRAVPTAIAVADRLQSDATATADTAAAPKFSAGELQLFMQNSRKFWEYTKLRDAAMSSILHQAMPNLGTTYPPFPNEILKSPPRDNQDS